MYCQKLIRTIYDFIPSLDQEGLGEVEIKHGLGNSEPTSCQHGQL